LAKLKVSQHILTSEGELFALLPSCGPGRHKKRKFWKAQL